MRKAQPKKRITLLLFCSIVLIVLAGSASHLIAYAYRYQAQIQLSQVEQAFEAEQQLALDKTTQAVDEHSIDPYIQNSDLSNTAGILNDFARKYNLSVMVAVNRDGIALARVPSPRKGDYVAQTTAWGRRAALGESVVTTGIGRNFPYIIQSAVPIKDNNSVVGAIYGGFLLDDPYAANFKERYLFRGSQVAFYAKETGIYGSSFADEDTKHLLKMYFSPGNDWAQAGQYGLSDELFRIADTSYLVGNIPLNGLDHAQGGILVFIPAHGYALSIVVVAIELILFVLLVLLFVRSIDKAERRYFIIFVVLSGVLLLGISYYQLSRRDTGYDVAAPPYAIYNSTIALTPDSDIFQVGSESRIALQITTGGEAINAARTRVSYDPTLLRVEDILMTNSFCNKDLVLEKKIDNEQGIVDISCVATEGFAKEKAIVAELRVLPIKEGMVDVAFDKETEVLAHDGLGTNVLRAVTNGTYQILNLQSSEAHGKVVLFSHTHPNQSAWYNKKQVVLNWVSPDGQPIVYSFDTNPDTIPPEHNVTGQQSFETHVDQDGIYYFHAKLPGSGVVSHYRVKVDTQPPSMVKIDASDKTVATGKVVRFAVDANDTASGMQKNYYIKFDSGVWLPTQPQIYTSFVGSGTHIVKVRAFDNANNFADAAVEIMVTKK